MKKRKKIFAILIAYNAEKTLQKFYESFPKKIFNEIILVDDASKDNTFSLAKKLKIKSFRNSHNLGYGGNLKRALNIGLKLGGDVFVDIHPDGEYKFSAISSALKKVDRGALLVLGNRFYDKAKPLRDGMYLWKYIPIRILNSFDSLFLGLRINDFHQGFRVYTKELLEKVESGAKAGTSAKKSKSKGPMVRGKKYQEAVKLIDKAKLYPLADAVKLVKQTSITKFDATVELHIALNPATLGDKTDYRGSVTLPHGTGKQVRVLVADDAIIAEITAGKINFDILVAHPTMMPKLAKVARILGPKGLMPNPKNNTISDNPEKLAEAIEKFSKLPKEEKTELGKNAIKFAERNFSPTVFNQKLKAVYNQLNQS